MKIIEWIRPADWQHGVWERIYQLEKYLQYLDRTTEKTSDKIRISQSNGTTQYYLVKKGQQNGKYVPANKRNLVRKIAQNNFNEKFRKKVQAETDFLREMLTKYTQVQSETYIKTITPSRREIITLPILTDEEYLHNWLAVTYNGKRFQKDADELRTSWGLRVRSKSEILIAEFLRKNTVPFRYEYPIHLGDHTVYPDFYCLNLRTRTEYIWEHLGKLDDPDYIAANLRKFEAYRQQGWHLGKNLIITYETADNALKQEMLARRVQDFLI